MTLNIFEFIVIISLGLFIIIVILRHLLRKYDIISFRESIMLLDTPVVTFMNRYNKKVRFLIDTGSDVNIITKESFAELFSKIELKAKDIKISSINNASKDDNNKYSTVILNFSYNNLQFSDVFVVIYNNDVFTALNNKTNIKVDGLLGSPFLKKYKYIVDFDELNIKVKK